MKTVLIVDDQPDHVELIRRFFEDADEEYALNTAGNLSKARAEIQEDTPDVVLVDNRLPDGEGRQLAKEGEDRFPVVLMTAHGDEHLAVRVMKDGVQDYVVKSPGRFAEMPGIVERAMREWDLCQASERAREEREITIDLLRLLNSDNDLHQLLRDVTYLLRNWSECEAVGIRLKNGEDYPYFETRGFPAEFIEAENELCSTDEDGQILRDDVGNPVLECMCGNVIRGRFDPEKPFFTENGSFWTNSTTELLASTDEADRQARTRNTCNGEGYESVALVPLRHGSETLGLLQFNSEQKDVFTKEKIGLLERLAGSLAIGLQHRKMAHELREREAELEAMMENTPFVMIIVDGEGRVRRINAAGAELAGRPQSELLGLPGGEAVCCIHALRFPSGCGKTMFCEDCPIRGAFRRTLRTGEKCGGVEVELNFARENDDGSGEEERRVLTCYTAPLQLHGEQMVLVALDDITDRKMAEEKIRYQKEVESMMTEISTRLVNADMDEIDLYIQDALASIRDFAGADRCFIFQFFADGARVSNTHECCAAGIKPHKDQLQNFHTEDFPWVMERLEDFQNVVVPRVEDLTSEAERFRIHLKEQGIQSVVGVPMISSKKLVGFIGLDWVLHEYACPDEIIDLLNAAGGTFVAALERKNKEEDLRGALEELRETQQQVVNQERHRALSTMASGIAHDFNNALTSIMGFVEVMLDKSKQEKYTDDEREYLQLIKTSANDAAESVRRMRKFYRPRGDEEYEPVDLNKVVEEGTSLTRPRWKQQAEAAGEHIRVDKDLDSIPLVLANEYELHELVTNLIFNAVDAIDESGEIMFSTYAEDDMVFLEVRDTGCGMDSETLDHCLEPFYSTKGASGSGLGLSTAEGVVRRHNGTIDIESEPGEGTRIAIGLPAWHGQSDNADENGRRVSKMESLDVLLVEDQDAQRLALEGLLEELGHRPESASNGLEGLRAFRMNWYDLIIVDRAMPGMNGDEVAQLVKKEAPEKPVLMLTGFGDIMNATADNPPAVDLVVSKPVETSELDEAIRMLVR